MEHCGIDVHQVHSEICILDDAGEVVERSKIRTSRPALTRMFKGRERMRVVIEAGGSSPWVSRLLEELGHEVIVCSPRRVRLIAESKLKNDKIDAETLARLVRIDPDFLKPIRHRSEEAQRLRCHVQVRRALVETRTKWINTVRGMLRAFGYRVAGKAPHIFVERVDHMDLPPELREVITPLLEQLDLLTGEIERCDQRLEELAMRIPAVEHLQQIPGIGPIVALYFVLSIDEPYRFRRSRDVGAFFGLRPSMRESGGAAQYGRITKEGDPEMRRLLVQAANAHLLSRQETALKQWAFEVERRRGKKKRSVALARKLAVVMHHMWVTGEDYRAFPQQPAAA